MLRQSTAAALQMSAPACQQSLKATKLKDFVLYLSRPHFPQALSGTWQQCPLVVGIGTSPMDLEICCSAPRTGRAGEGTFCPTGTPPIGVGIGPWHCSLGQLLLDPHRCHRSQQGDQELYSLFLNAQLKENATCPIWMVRKTLEEVGPRNPSWVGNHTARGEPALEPGKCLSHLIFSSGSLVTPGLYIPGQTSLLHWHKGPKHSREGPAERMGARLLTILNVQPQIRPLESQGIPTEHWI